MDGGNCNADCRNKKAPALNRGFRWGAPSCYAFAALIFAHLARAAAAIFLRVAGLITRAFLTGFSAALAALNAAHRFLAAAMIRALPSALMWRFFFLGALAGRTAWGGLSGKAMPSRASRAAIALSMRCCSAFNSDKIAVTFNSSSRYHPLAFSFGPPQNLTEMSDPCTKTLRYLFWSNSVAIAIAAVLLSKVGPDRMEAIGSGLPVGVTSLT